MLLTVLMRKLQRAFAGAALDNGFGLVGPFHKGSALWVRQPFFDCYHAQ